MEIVNENIVKNTVYCFPDGFIIKSDVEALLKGNSNKGCIINSIYALNYSKIKIDEIRKMSLNDFKKGDYGEYIGPKSFGLIKFIFKEYVTLFPEEVKGNKELERDFISKQQEEFDIVDLDSNNVYNKALSELSECCAQEEKTISEKEKELDSLRKQIIALENQYDRILSEIQTRQKRLKRTKRYLTDMSK